MSEVNSNLACEGGSDISEVVFGWNNGIRGINDYQPIFGSMFQMNEVNSNATNGSGNNISDFSFTPTKEVYEPQGDLFDMIFPPKQARVADSDPFLFSVANENYDEGEDNILFPMIDAKNEKYGGSRDQGKEINAADGSGSEAPINPFLYD